MTRRTTRSCRLEGDYVSVCCAQVWLKPCLPNLTTTPSGSLCFLFTGSWDVPASRNFNEIELLLRSVWFRNSDFRFMIYRRSGACFCRSGNLGMVRNNPLIQTTVIQTTNKMRDMKPVMKTGTTIWTLYGFVHVQVVTRFAHIRGALHTRGCRLALMSSMSIARYSREVPSKRR